MRHNIFIQWRREEDEKLWVSLYYYYCWGVDLRSVIEGMQFAIAMFR